MQPPTASAPPPPPPPLPVSPQWCIDVKETGGKGDMLALEQESEQHKPDQHDDALINPATSTVTSLERLERLERMRAADDTDTALEVKMPHAQDRARVKEAALAAASAGAQQLGVSQRYENAKQDTASAQTLSQLESELGEEGRRHREVLGGFGKRTAVNNAPARIRNGNAPPPSAEPAAHDLSSLVERTPTPPPAATATATATIAAGNKIGAAAASHQMLALNPIVSEASNQCPTFGASTALSPASTIQNDNGQVQVSFPRQDPERLWSPSSGPVWDNKSSLLSVVRTARDKPSVMSVISAARRAATAFGVAEGPTSNSAANNFQGTCTRQAQPLSDKRERYLRAVAPTTAVRTTQPAVYGEALYPAGNHEQEGVANQTLTVGNQAGEATAEQAQVATTQPVTNPPTISMGSGNLAAAPEHTPRLFAVKQEPQEAAVVAQPRSNGVSSPSLLPFPSTPETNSSPCRNSARSIESETTSGDRPQQAATAVAQAAALPTVTTCSNAGEPRANDLAASQHDGSKRCPSVAAFVYVPAVAAAAAATAADEGQGAAQQNSPRRLTKFVPVVGPVSTPATAVPSDGDQAPTARDDNQVLPERDDARASMERNDGAQAPARRTSPRLLAKFFPIVGPVSAPATSVLREGEQASSARDDDEAPPARHTSPRALKPFSPVVGPVSTPLTAIAKAPSSVPAARKSVQQAEKCSLVSPGPVIVDKPSAPSVPSAARKDAAKSTSIAPRPPPYCAAASKAIVPDDLMTFLRKATPSALRAAQTAVYGHAQHAAGNTSGGCGDSNQEQIVASQTPGIGFSINRVTARNGGVEIVHRENAAAVNQQQGNDAVANDEERVGPCWSGVTANQGQQLGMAGAVQGAASWTQGLGQGAEANVPSGTFNTGLETVSCVQRTGYQAIPQMASSAQPMMVCPSVAVPWMPLYQRPVFQFLVYPMAPAHTASPYCPSYSQGHPYVVLPGQVSSQSSNAVAAPNMKPIAVPLNTLPPPGGVVPGLADNGPQRYPLGPISAASDASATCRSKGEVDKDVVRSERENSSTDADGAAKRKRKGEEVPLGNNEDDNNAADGAVTTTDSNYQNIGIAANCNTNDNSNHANANNANPNANNVDNANLNPNVDSNPNPYTNASPNPNTTITTTTNNNNNNNNKNTTAPAGNSPTDMPLQSIVDGSFFNYKKPYGRGYSCCIRRCNEQWSTERLARFRDSVPRKQGPGSLKRRKMFVHDCFNNNQPHIREGRDTLQVCCVFYIALTGISKHLVTSIKTKSEMAEVHEEQAHMPTWSDEDIVAWISGLASHWKPPTGEAVICMPFPSQQYVYTLLIASARTTSTSPIFANRRGPTYARFAKLWNAKCGHIRVTPKRDEHPAVTVAAAAAAAASAIPATQMPRRHHHYHHDGDCRQGDRRPSPDATTSVSNRGGVGAGLTSTPAAAAVEKSESPRVSSPKGQTQHARVGILPLSAAAEGAAASRAGSSGSSSSSSGRADGEVEWQRQSMDVGEATPVMGGGGRIPSPLAAVSPMLQMQTQTQIPQVGVEAVVTVAQDSSSVVLEKQSGAMRKQQQPAAAVGARKGGGDAPAKHEEGRRRGRKDAATADLAMGDGVSTPSPAQAPAPLPPQLPVVALPGPLASNSSVAPFTLAAAERTEGREQVIEPPAAPRPNQRIDGLARASGTPSPVVGGSGSDSGGGDARGTQVQSGLVRIAPAPGRPTFDYRASALSVLGAATRGIAGRGGAVPKASGDESVSGVGIDVSAWPDPAKAGWRR